MKAEEFRVVLQHAVEGSQSDVEIIIRLYMPLVNKYSYWQGKLDEDLRQHILLHIVRNISKFDL